MEERDKKTELLVGLFLTCGLLLLGTLILQFSSVREVFKTTYEITVPFPDGTGIREGTPVMLGGSRIGKVSARPRLNATFNGVTIPLEIYSEVNIPVDSKFGIGTAGLLGDAYIEVNTTNSKATEYIQHEAVIPESNITKTSGLSGLQSTAESLGKQLDVAIEDIRTAVADIRLSLKRVNEGALSEQSSADLKSAIAHLNKTITRLDENILGEQTAEDVKAAVASFRQAAQALENSTKKLEPAIAKFEPVMAKLDTTVTSVDKAVKTFDTTVADIGRLAKNMDRGAGLLPALIHDQDLKGHFSALIGNIRHRGLLFYKDVATQDEQKGRTSSPPATNRPTTPRKPMSGKR